MSAPPQPTAFGRSRRPDEVWLAKLPPEPVLEPDIPIVDPHHHLWERFGYCYLLDEYLADVNSGHHVIATVFEECHSMYRASGPEEMRSLGETEFVAGIAAMSESGTYGPTQVAAGIVGNADLMLGDRVEPVLEAHLKAGGGRFRGVRHSAGWDADEIIGNSADVAGPHLYMNADFRAGLARLTALGLTFDAWLYHPQLADIIDLAKSAPDANIVMCHVGGPLGYGPYAGKGDDVFASWKASMTELATCPNVSVKLGGMTMRLAAFDYGTCRHHCPQLRSRPIGALIWRRVLSCSARTAACSRATIRWKKWASVGSRCGTPSNILPRTRPNRKNWRCLAELHSGCIV